MNKKGFTLIELLAVIVILAIIAVITVPIVLNSIATAKQGAFKSSSYGLLSASEFLYAQDVLTNQQDDVFILFDNGDEYIYPEGKALDYKGEKPTYGGIRIYADGKIESALYDGTYCSYKALTSDDVVITTTTQKECTEKVFYYQTSEPFNNIVKNGDFSKDLNNNNIPDSWSLYNAIGNTILSSQVGYNDNSSVEITNNGTSSKMDINQNNVYILNNNYYYNVKVLAKTEKSIIGATYVSNNHAQGHNINPNMWMTLSNIDFADSSYTLVRVMTADASFFNSGDKVYFDDFIVIELTNRYGSNNEPTKEEMDRNIEKVWIDADNNTPYKFTAGGWVNL